MARVKKSDSYTSYAKHGKKMQNGGRFVESPFAEMQRKRKAMEDMNKAIPKAKPKAKQLVESARSAYEASRKMDAMKAARKSSRKVMKNGGKTSFGMLSVKAGVDKNPNPTAADRIAGAKMRAGKMRSGGTVGKSLGTYGRQLGKNYSGKGGKMKTCKYGC